MFVWEHRCHKQVRWGPALTGGQNPSEGPTLFDWRSNQLWTVCSPPCVHLAPIPSSCYNKQTYRTNADALVGLAEAGVAMAKLAWRQGDAAAAATHIADAVRQYSECLSAYI